MHDHLMLFLHRYLSDFCLHSWVLKIMFQHKNVFVLFLCVLLLRKNFTDSCWNPNQSLVGSRIKSPAPLFSSKSSLLLILLSVGLCWTIITSILIFYASFKISSSFWILWSVLDRRVMNREQYVHYNDLMTLFAW